MSDVSTTPRGGGKHRPSSKPSRNAERQGDTPGERSRGPGGVKPGGSRDRKAKDSKGRERGFFRRFWWAFVLVPAVAFLGVVGTFWYVYAHTAIPDAPPGPQTTFVYDRSGHLITKLHPEVNRTIIPFSHMPLDPEPACRNTIGTLMGSYFAR